MGEARFLIGGHGLRITGGDTLKHVLQIPGMKVFLSPDVKCDMTVRLDQPLPLPSCRWQHEYDIADGNIHCRFGRDAEGCYWNTFGQRGLLRFREDEGVDVNTLENFSSLRFALWTAYALMGVGLGAVPVHSSVVVCDGKAVMCLGESGTGKSTHTRLWTENIPHARLLNDDSPILVVNDGKARVYGSPWSGKTHCYLQESYPLAGLLRLEQRPENSIRRLRILESFAALQPSCPPVLAHDEYLTDTLVEFISKVIGCSPVYRMGCLPDAAAAQMSHKTIMG